MLVGKPLIGGRSWDSNFFLNIHDALASRVIVVNELSLDEVASELDALVASAAATTARPDA